MKSLAERHADRAQRKVDNAVFSIQPSGGDIGMAAFRISEAQAAIAALTPEQRDELKELMPEDGFSDASAEADASAYDAAGNLKTAGIGVVNPLVAPVAAAMAVEGAQSADTPLGGQTGNGGWGTPPEPSLTPADGNQNGAAVVDTPQDQTDAQNERSEADRMVANAKPPVNVNMTIAKLQEIAAAEGADLSQATNNEMRVAAIEANRTKLA
jgi:hypothetical protein